MLHVTAGGEVILVETVVHCTKSTAFPISVGTLCQISPQEIVRLETSVDSYQ